MKIILKNIKKTVYYILILYALYITFQTHI